jgi:hypothetical protein
MNEAILPIRRSSVNRAGYSPGKKTFVTPNGVSRPNGTSLAGSSKSAFPRDVIGTIFESSPPPASILDASTRSVLSPNLSRLADLVQFPSSKNAQNRHK